jgi:hypothetical protein
MGIPNGAGCCEKEAQVISALAGQEGAVEKLVSLAEEVRTRVIAVLAPLDASDEKKEGELRPTTSPLAEKIININLRARYGQAVLRDILDRLEI